MNKVIRDTYVLIPIILAIGATLIGLVITFPELRNGGQELFVEAIASFLGGALIVLAVILLTRSNPQLLKVAIVGYPKTGKTSLIISIFDECFIGNLNEFKVALRGQETIERVNSYIMLLKNRKAIGPTKSEDRFGFTADISKRKYFIRNLYKVEFGDFPGDDVKEYLEKYGIWLHTTEYFKWVMDSDALIFIIDLGQYLKRPALKNEYVTNMTSSLRAAWQHFADINSVRSKKLKYYPLLLVFTKADLLISSDEPKVDHESMWDNYERKIQILGYNQETPPMTDININESVLEFKESEVLSDFADLIHYFKSETSNFHYIFCSCFDRIDGKRLGINEIIPSILP